jgi:hypothetical protein
LLNLDKNHYHNFSGRGFAVRRDPISLFNDVINGYNTAFSFRDALRKIAAERYAIEKNISNVLQTLASKKAVDIDQLVNVLRDSKIPRQGL